MGGRRVKPDGTKATARYPWSFPTWGSLTTWLTALELRSRFIFIKNGRPSKKMAISAMSMGNIVIFDKA
jgi:hypothetical protein